MAGTTVTVEEPDYVQTKSVDKAGRLYLGKDYAGAEVRVVVERIGAEESDE
jgi:hypothetical protein